ncbi:MAG: zinc-binding dehydrogenase [Alphaproteobacteria bacterium]
MTTAMMTAGVATEDGLVVREVPRPEAGPEQVLVRVRAAGLNRADLGAAKALYLPGGAGMNKPIGLEWAGEVVGVGEGVSGIKEGDRVLASGSGGYAEYAVTDMGRVLPIPANNMSYEQAAGLPIALITMHNAVVTQGRLAKGEAVLIQGASSGVGLMGMQIAKAMGAELVIGSSTTDARRARLGEFGADLAIDSSDGGWADQVLEATGGDGVHLIVDMISAGVMNDNMKATRVLGRIVNVGRLGGFTGEFDFDLHARKRIDYIGVTFRTRSIEEVREIVWRMREDLWEAVTAGDLSLPIDKTFALKDAVAAQEHMRANEHFGKIILTG